MISFVYPEAHLLVTITKMLCSRKSLHVLISLDF